MLDKLLYELIETIIGKNGRAIVDILKNKSDVNEFKIADKLKITINQLRNLLYKLDAQDVVSFIRKKDKQKGWYIYYWSLNVRKALELLAKLKEKEIHQLNSVLKSHENKRFYFCKLCDIELTEETALNHDFLCPECGSLLQLQDNKDKILDIKKKIAKESKMLQDIRAEISKLEMEKPRKIKAKPKKARKKKIAKGKRRKKKR
jgi:transcription initiation factor TFIIE subunit alpha